MAPWKPHPKAIGTTLHIRTNEAPSPYAGRDRRMLLCVNRLDSLSGKAEDQGQEVKRLIMLDGSQALRMMINQPYKALEQDPCSVTLHTFDTEWHSSKNTDFQERLSSPSPATL